MVEVIIALFVRDAFLRPYGGDTLAVMLLYCFIQSGFNFPWLKVAIGSWIFACCLEVLQALNLLAYLELRQNEMANVVVGNTFAWLDIVAYTAGLLIIVVVEISRRNGEKKTS
ncbi:MAG: DUF2809 domain-containing protein [Ferruginibacter sp.]|nr:DUF2809 domain-containing protein [Ferruginibacter sp.]